ncbi:putative polysaccharide biosynthesis protein [Planococcus lenghuensis]|uniref:Cell division protein n=1 Tax=Planococcus lenghuensis TaxID=2213202 RepID=A0A1Q2KX20_9BACL|nr:polysaccharide biosynthesis protein [Planococcus lenghuensis]AQQ52765.1 cell division protein [Planococcus lenghuensis]
MSTLMKGTAILTIGLFLSKVLGVLYVIPFYALVGAENIALYMYAYIPYNLMLSIAIAGAPLAFSKFVSKYNALGDYETGRKLLKSGLMAMLATGFAAFLILFSLAGPLASIIIADNEQIFTVDDVRNVIRWVSFALIAVPFMSLLRGFFQGYNFMTPTAVSQLIEQIVRILFLLGSAFVIIYLLGGSAETAIQAAVFSAFIGALGGLVVLYYYWRKKKPEYNELLEESGRPHNIGMKDMYKEIAVYALPIIFLGSANPLFQFADLLTFNEAMSESVYADVSDVMLGILNFNAHKLVLIPVMLATGFSMALIPLITKYFTTDQPRLMTRTLDQTFQILMFLTLPAVAGMMILSDELYMVFYEESEFGSAILASYLPAAVLFSLFPVTAAILQGIDRQKWIVINLGTGLLLKLLLNIPFVRLWEVDGAISATMVGYSAAIVMNMAVIYSVLNYKSKIVLRRVLLIGILTAAMAAAAALALIGVDLIIPLDSKLQAILRIMIVGLAGGAVYAFLGLQTGLAQRLFGDRLTKLTRKFGF